MVSEKLRLWRKLLLALLTLAVYVPSAELEEAESHNDSLGKLRTQKTLPER